MTARGAARLGLGVLALALAVAAPRGAAGDDLDTLRREIDELRRGQQRLERELRDLRSLAARPASARRAQDVAFETDIGDAVVRGAPDGGVVVVEFSDYDCPFCGRHARQTRPPLEAGYVATGKVRYVFRDFPIESTHPRAFGLAVAARCAGEQARYWAMRDRLFADQSAHEASQIRDHARALGLDVAAFSRCLPGEEAARRVREDMAEGRRLGVQGTPTFFFGRSGPDGRRVTLTRMVVGAVPYAVFRETIEELLGTASSESRRP